MPQLPTEVWLLIVSYCDPRDLWLSLRQVNRQLLLCAEQYFQEELLPLVELILPVAITTYDMRGQTRARAVFHCQRPTLLHRWDRASYCLTRIEPELYRLQFLDRWKRSCDSSPTGSLNQKMAGEMRLKDRADTVILRTPSIGMDQHDMKDCARISFEWKATMTSFFR